MADDIVIKGPDGSTNKFPAGTPDDVITRAMREVFPPPATSGFEPALPGALSDDPRDWEKPAQPLNPEAATAHKPSLLNMGQDIYEAIKAARKGPEAVTGQDVLALGGLSPAAPGKMLTREAAQAVAASDKATARALLPGEQATADRYAGKARLTPREETAKTARDIGVKSLPRAATGGLVEQSTAGGLTATPLGTPLISASKRATQELEEAKSGVVDAMGSGSRSAAGEGTRDEIIGWLEKGSQAEANRIFQPLDDIVTQGEKALTAAGKSPNRPLDHTRLVEARLRLQADRAKLDPPPILDLIERAIEPGAELAYKDLQFLRTQIGDMMSGKITPEPGMSTRALEQIYGSLSRDLEEHFTNLGQASGMTPAEARATFRTTNSRFSEEIAAKRNALAKILGVDGKAPAELVVDRLQTMAGAKGGADIARLQQARSVMGDDAWNEIGSAIIARMGETKDGMSIARFRTEYEGLSEEGKTLLFGSGPGSHRETLDKIAEVGRLAEQLGKWGNPSGTTRGMVATGAIATTIFHPYAAAAGAVGNSALAYLLSRPMGADLVYRFMEAYMAHAANPSAATQEALLQTMRLLGNEVAVGVTSPDRARKLPPGTWVRTPDGRVARTKIINE